ncbi:hypothetical protein Tco_0295726 [Tanacetum coccineum]
MKTPMSSDTKLTKDEECESVDNTKYRGMIGSKKVGVMLYSTKFRKANDRSRMLFDILGSEEKEEEEGKETNHSLAYIPLTEVRIRQLFSYSLEDFAQILNIPCEGACIFTDRWRVDELAYGIPSDGPYHTNPPSIDVIISSIRIDREGQVRRIRHEEEIDVLEYQILTREIVSTLKPLEKIIQENVFCLGV